MVQDRWHQHFINMCLENAKMSKDPSTRVGALIVGPDREIRSAGFNGFPRGVLDTKERLNDRDIKNRLVVHAELNAILSAARVGTPLKGCIMYMAAMTDGEIWGGCCCLRCAVELIQAGIIGLVTVKNCHSRWKDSCEEASAILREAGVWLHHV